MARLEAAAGQNLAGYVAAYRAVAPEIGAEAIEFAGGVAAFCGVDSPLTTVKGIGAEITLRDLASWEDFLQKKNAAVATIESAPWLSGRSQELLLVRGYQVGSEERVLLRTRVVTDQPPHSVSRFPAAEWSEVMRRGFELPDSPAMMALVCAAGALDGAQLWGVRGNHHWIACAQSVTYDDVVVFGCDGTLPPERGRGAQRTLILHRLQEAGPVKVVTAEVMPGGGSERNYLRCGFEIAYKRTHYVRQLH